LGKAGRRTENTGSQAAFEKLKGWLQSCLTEHGACAAQRPALLPRTVLDISMGQVKLFQPNGLRADYACLSHCWGLKPIITTTRENLTDFLRQIPWDGLSKTFQDAIIVTRKLGLGYLWIDSLSIVQDDIDDWSSQAPMMADYYSNALLTIASTASSNGAEGL
jgi:hypothetical protein